MTTNQTTRETEHTEACYAMPFCTICGKRKAPRGRSVPDATAMSRCTAECTGYNEDPQPGHLWPDERKP